MADTQNATAQNATAQNATAQTDPPQIVDNIVLYAILSSIKILKPLKNNTTLLARDPVIVITVDDNVVYTSKKLNMKVLPLLEVNREICFKTSSTIKIEIIRPSRNIITKKQHILGVHQGKILNLIGKDIKCDLKDGTEDVTGLTLTFVSSSLDDIIKKIEASTSGLDHGNIKTISAFVDTGSSLAVPLGQALDIIAKLTKKLSNIVHPILSISCSVLLSAYQVIKAQTKQDETVQKLVEALKDMLLACQDCHILPEFSKPGNAIENMAYLIVEVGALLEKYNLKCFAARALKAVISPEMQIQINELQEKVDQTKHIFQREINIGTRLRVEKIYGVIETKEQRAWFLNLEQYIQWKQKVDSFLWISGKRSGKTILSSTIIQDIQEHCANIYGDGEKQPLLHALQSCLQELMLQFEHIYLVLDALDECAENEIKNLLLWIESNYQNKTERLHFLATSRDSHVIKQYLKDIEHMVLDSNSDIQRYLESIFQNDKLFPGLGSLIKQEIKDTLSSKANGMFQWVILQLNELEECNTQDDLDKNWEKEQFN
ncbi:hypothetical protein BDQ12DRAFT_670849 [Crucibulum laeve]|uniref:Nephrocystin 3-like N-terminal domain-containing protein n=1 Tax=Crucibulum laeve TaxID=68775 RepID=A0A5C3LIP3_9AGAR|nr:hypothetical protein BDQ12DRAFT_670849 [Crucibulum laeve]